MSSCRTTYAGLLRILLLLVTAAVVSSCRQKQLEDPPAPGEALPLEVRFDWQYASDAAPEGMTVWFFPADGASLRWRFDISGREGGPIELPCGRYRMIAVNNDLRGVQVSSEDYLGFTVHARPYPGQELTMPTGMLYGAAVDYVEVSPTEVRYTRNRQETARSPGRIIRAAPDSLATVYHIRVTDIKGIERVRTVQAILSGVAASVDVPSGSNSSRSVAMSASMQIRPSPEPTLTADAAAFGTPAAEKPRFTLEIILSTSHAVYSKIFDVSEQILNSPWKRNVHIRIKGLEIPDSDPVNPPDKDPDVGINVGVDGWSLVEITYS